ncbi:MAG: amidohydrolase family protein [Candidatus Eremiobacteraeota bacterium]|nr:amidohydrolase family protein [Candidatus Eremiobacteraeota bacterium]
MIIDAHTHVHRVPGSFWDSPPERLLALMEEAGVEKSVIMSYGGAPAEVSIDYIDECVRKYPGKFIGYANINLAEEKDPCGLLRHAIEDLGFKGLKLHPVAYHMLPAHESSLELLKEAGRLGVPALFHCGDEEYTMPLQIAEAAALAPGTTFILGHMGGYFHCADALKAAEHHANIMLETSAMPYPSVIREAVKLLGAARVIFASDGPGCPPHLDAEKVRCAGLSSAEEACLFHGNIERLHGA